MTRSAVSVVVPVWNAVEVTRNFLELLPATLGPGDEVVVVDNGSTDATPQLLAAHLREHRAGLAAGQQDRFRFVTHEENLGFAAGCNAGAALATNPVVVFLNNDTLPTGDWIGPLVQPLDDDDRVGATGPMSNYVSGPQLLDDSLCWRPADVAQACALARRAMTRASADPVPVERLVGFCLAVRTRVLRGLGGFDESFRTGGYEDDDLCRRITGAGWRLLMVHRSFVWHIGHVSFQENGLDVAAVEREHREVYLAKHADQRLLSLVLVCGDDVGPAATTLVDLVDAVAGVDAELVLVSRGSGVAAHLAGSIDGPVVVVEAAGASVEEAAEQGLLGASGWRRAVAVAGESLDDAALGALLGSEDPTLRTGRVSVPPPAPARPDHSPAVTVLVRTVNRPELLRRCLASLDAQYLRSFEVVVVNDCGVDVSAVTGVLSPDVTVTVRTPDAPLGRAGALNEGLRTARGQWVCILDDDDVVHPDHLAHLLQGAEAADGPDVVYTQALEAVEDGDGRVLSRRLVHARDHSRDALLRGNYLPILTVLFPRHLALEAGGWDEDLPVLEDWEFWLRLSAVSDFRALGVVTAEYRVRGDRSNSTSSCTGIWGEALARVDTRHPATSPAQADARRALRAAWGAARHAFPASRCVVLDLAAARREHEAWAAQASGDQLVLVLTRDAASERFADDVRGPAVDVVLVTGVDRHAAAALAQRRCLGAVVVDRTPATTPVGAPVGALAS